MNTKKYVAPIALAAALTLTLTACGTTETSSAPSSTGAASNSAVRELRLARAEEGKRELRLSVAAAIPHTVDREYAAAAASDRTPFIFSYGTGCAWMRMPDKSLWSLNGAGGALTRDVAAEKEFGSWPGAGERRVCEPATGIPDADDPSVTAPYRWIDHGRVAIRVNGKHHELPDQIPESGEVLGGPTTPTN